MPFFVVVDVVTRAATYRIAAIATRTDDFIVALVHL